MQFELLACEEHHLQTLATAICHIIMHNDNVVHITKVIAAMVEAEGTERQFPNRFGVCILFPWFRLKSEAFHAVLVMKHSQETDGSHQLSCKDH